MSDEDQKAIDALREWGSLMRQADAAVKKSWNTPARAPGEGDSPEYTIAAGLRAAEQAQALVVERLARQLGSHVTETQPLDRATCDAPP